jgi:vitamin B12 transporter
MDARMLYLLKRILSDRSVLSVLLAQTSLLVRTSLLVLTGMLVFALPTRAQRASSPAIVEERTSPDSVRAFRIGEVTVTAPGQRTGIQTTTPLQQLDRNALQATAAAQVSDAVKFFSGVNVKDYGGLGGMKTLSVRSMGAQHTAVSYDGIVLTDCQTGQTDLGRYSLENVDLISLSIGDGNSIFQPALAFASSGILTIRSRRPVFVGKSRFNGNISYQFGSFRTQVLNLLGSVRLSEEWSLSLDAQMQQSDGDYPYQLAYGDGPSEYTTEIRTNNALKNLRLESFLIGKFDENRSVEVKTYWYQSDRGLPGAVILYNPVSSQHLWDRTIFVQAHYEQKWKEKLIWQVNTKVNQTNQRYLNPDYLGSTGQEDYNYGQKEAYLSSAFLYQPWKNLSFALATDGSVAGMESNLNDFSEPTRWTGLANLSAKLELERLLITSGILATGIQETTQNGRSAEGIRRLSPSVNVSYQPISTFEGLRLRAFYKSSFRAPSFNDLYYSAIGNTSLKPENSKQADLGFTYGFRSQGETFRLNLTTDVFYNRITDKIMAVPTKNIFIWSMVNLGKVNITGLDFNLEASRKWKKDLELTAAWNHSYQRALDLTDPTSKVYNQQIAYAPRVYGSGRLSLVASGFQFGYALLYSGHRYVTGQNITENDLPGYVDQSVSVRYTLKRLWGDLVLRGDIQNLADTNYEIVRNFPMPGRMMLFTVQFDF